MGRILVCITGASGAIYPLRLLSALAVQGITIHLTCSPWGSRVVLEETGRTLGYWLGKIRSSGGPQGSGAIVVFHPSEDFSSPVASGSFRLDGTVILPCSMGSLGSIASGVCSNLVHRAGAVALKEGWPLILVPRESPLSLVDIRSMERAKESGAVILPACPSFYSRPRSIEDLADTLVHRILDRLGVPSPDASRWGMAARTP